MVACFKLKRPTSFVGIAFLSCLGSFQVGLYAVDNLLGLREKVRAKYHPFARLNLVCRCTTTMTIQSLEGRHSESLLIAVVV
jgi:hypothetical protein